MAVPMAFQLLVVIFLPAAAVMSAEVVEVRAFRTVAAKKNLSCFLIFGDSSVDPGNNNRLDTASKSNFPPYGEDFIHGHGHAHPTGRFTNGRLPTDFIAEKFGHLRIIRGFLDPHLEKKDLLYGVSFASAASGYDDLTANLSNVISLTKQVEYFKHYKLHLRKLIGAERAEESIQNAVFFLSFGTNDFLQNYFLNSLRSRQYSTVPKYQDYLVSRMSTAIKEMHYLGARRVAVVGDPPFGCIPLARTIRGDSKSCDVELNQVAASFNLKLKSELDILKTSLRIQTFFIDIYSVILNVMQNPKLYGFTETWRGCCGTGMIEYGNTCRGLSTCPDRTKYVFWDAVHLTETAYKILADASVETIFAEL